MPGFIPGISCTPDAGDALSLTDVDGFFVVEAFAVVDFFAVVREVVAFAPGKTRDDICAVSFPMLGMSFLTGICGMSCMPCMSRIAESSFAESGLVCVALSRCIDIPGMFFMSCVDVALVVSRRPRDESDIFIPGIVCSAGCASVAGMRIPGVI